MPAPEREPRFPAGRLALMYAACTAILLAPLPWKAADHFLEELDSHLNCWILAWGPHALATRPGRFFDGNIFHPNSDTLAYSENMIGNLPIFAPLHALTGNPVLSCNLLLLGSFWLCALAMAALAWHWTRDPFAAAAAGLAFGFSPVRIGEAAHIQLLAAWWLPLAFLFAERLRTGRRWRDALLLALCVVWQFAASIYLGYLLAAGLVLYLAWWGFRGDPGSWRAWFSPRWGAVAGVVAAGVVPLLLPYLRVSRTWQFARTIQENAYYAAEPLSFLNAQEHSLLYGSWLRPFRWLAAAPHAQSALFPGLVVAGLAVLGFMTGRKAADTAGRASGAFGFVAVASAVLALGPLLVLRGQTLPVPLPYLVPYFLVPGFQAIRAPYRFGIVLALALAALVAIGVAALRTRRPRLATPIGIGALVLLGLDLSNRPLPVFAAQVGAQVPAVYRFLARDEDRGPVLELPFDESRGFYGFQISQSRKTYFSLYHWRPLLNGYSGFHPPTFWRLLELARGGPSCELIDQVAALGATTLVSWDDASGDALRSLGLVPAAGWTGHPVVFRIPPSYLRPAEPTWVLRAPDRLPPGKVLGVGLEAALPPGTGWRPSRARGVSNLTVEWLPDGPRQRVRFEWPDAVTGSRPWRGQLRILVPDATGSYRMRVVAPEFQAEAPISVANDLLADSARDSGDVAARLEVSGPRTALAGGPVWLSVAATNTGRAVWLRDPEQTRGDVRVGFRWRDRRSGAEAGSGRILLPYSVYPGQTLRLREAVAAPGPAGDYLLELDMVSELMTWFADRGSRPAVLEILVRRP